MRLFKFILNLFFPRPRKQVVYVPMWSCAGRTLVRLEVYR